MTEADGTRSSGSDPPTVRDQLAVATAGHAVVLFGISR
jgi:hypothetical protein